MASVSSQLGNCKEKGRGWRREGGEGGWGEGERERGREREGE